MKTIILCLFALFMLHSSLSAQTYLKKGKKWTLKSSGKEPFCPSKFINGNIFELVPNEGDIKATNPPACTYSWEFTNAKIANSSQTNLTTLVTTEPKATIYFDNTIDKAIIKVTISKCGTGNLVYEITETYEVIIRSIREVFPKNLSINGNTSSTFNVQNDNTDESFTLAVDPIKIPNTELYADLYEYRIPKAWNFVAQPNPYIDVNTNEKVVWVPNVTGSSTNTQVKIKLDACSRGKIRVRGLIDFSTCPYVDNNEQKAGIFSQYANDITINRSSIPSTTITVGDFLINGNGGNVECGKSGIATVRVTTALKNITSANDYKYRWEIVPQGTGANWSFINPSAVNNVLVTPATTNAAGLIASIDLQSVPNVDLVLKVIPVPLPSNCLSFSEAITTVKVNRVKPTLTISKTYKNALCSPNKENSTINLFAYNGINFSYDYRYLDRSQDLVVVSQDASNPSSFTVSPVNGTASGLAKIAFTVTNSCGIKSEESVAEINLSANPPTILGRLYTNEKEVFCLNRQKAFWIAPVTNAIAYRWQVMDKDVYIDYDGTTAMILVSSYGSKKFKIIASNGCGEISKEYRVAANQNPLLPCMLNTGTDGNLIDLYSSNVYPNPVDDILHIALPSLYSETLSIKLYDAMGQVRKTVPSQNIDLQTNTISFSVADLPIGTYFLHIIDQDMLKQYQVLIVR